MAHDLGQRERGRRRGRGLDPEWPGDARPRLTNRKRAIGNKGDLGFKFGGLMSPKLGTRSRESGPRVEGIVSLDA